MMSIERAHTHTHTPIPPERTTRLAYMFIEILFDWWVMRVEKELFLLLGCKGHDIDDAIIDRSASNCVFFFAHTIKIFSPKENQK